MSVKLSIKDDQKGIGHGQVKKDRKVKIIKRLWTKYLSHTFDY